MIKKWAGDEIKKMVYEAAAKGINKTMTDCVVFAKENHSAGAARVMAQRKWNRHTGKKQRKAIGKGRTQYGYGEDTSRGWHNITGTAEGSISIHHSARPNSLYGLWGSKAVEYFKNLEFRHGHILLKSRDVNYPSLIPHIKESFA